VHIFLNSCLKFVIRIVVLDHEQKFILAWCIQIAMGLESEDLIFGSKLNNSIFWDKF